MAELYREGELLFEVQNITIHVYVERVNPNKNASCKHVNWKILIQSGSF